MFVLSLFLLNIDNLTPCPIGIKKCKITKHFKFLITKLKCIKPYKMVFHISIACFTRDSNNSSMLQLCTVFLGFVYTRGDK